MKSTLIGPKVAAQILGVNYTTVFRQTWNGRLKPAQRHPLRFEAQYLLEIARQRAVMRTRGIRKLLAERGENTCSVQ
jgi:hypothetical protein